MSIDAEENQRWHDQLIKDNAKGHDDWLEAREAIVAVLSRVTKKLLRDHPNNPHTIREQLQAQADAILGEQERVKRVQRGGRAC